MLLLLKLFIKNLTSKIKLQYKKQIIFPEYHRNYNKCKRINSHNFGDWGKNKKFNKKRH